MTGVVVLSYTGHPIVSCIAKRRMTIANRGYILDISQVAYEVIQGFRHMATVWDRGIMLNYYVYGKSYMKNIAFQASFLYGRKMNYVELLCIWQVLHGKWMDLWIGKNELCLNYYSCITQIIIQRLNICMGKPIQNIFG